MNQIRKPLKRRWSDDLGPAEDPQAPWAMSQQWPLVVTALTQDAVDLLNVLEASLQRPAAGEPAHDAPWRQMRPAMDRLRETALRGQQITRLAIGRIRQGQEPVDLAGVVQAVLQDRRRDLDAAGATVRTELQPLQTLLGPTLAFSLVDSLVQWMLTCGRELLLKVESVAWPPTSRLVAHVSARGAMPAAAGGAKRRRRNDGLRWALLRQVAAAAGLEVRLENAGGTTVYIDLPLALDLRHGAASAAASVEVSIATAPSWVLVIAIDPELLSCAVDALSAAGFEAKAASTAKQAWRLLEHDRPGGVILADDARGGAFDALRAELLAANGPRPLIEITAGRSPLGHGGLQALDLPTVAREDIDKELAATLFFELTKAG